MIVEVLSFAGCPHAEPALARVRAVLAAEALCAEIRTIDIRDAADAVVQCFLGSPTVRIDGADVEIDSRGRTDFAFACRTYETPEGPSGVPPHAMLVDALRRGQAAPARVRQSVHPSREEA